MKIVGIYGILGWGGILGCFLYRISHRVSIEILEHEEVRGGEGSEKSLGSWREWVNSVRMNGSESDGSRRRVRFNWREDLARSRDLATREIEAYG